MEIKLEKEELKKLKEIDNTISNFLLELGKIELEYKKRKKAITSIIDNFSEKGTNELKKIAQKHNINEKNIIRIDYENNKLIIKDNK